MNPSTLTIIAALVIVAAAAAATNMVETSVDNTFLHLFGNCTVHYHLLNLDHNALNKMEHLIYNNNELPGTVYTSTFVQSEPDPIFYEKCSITILGITGNNSRLIANHMRRSPYAQRGSPHSIFILLRETLPQVSEAYQLYPGSFQGRVFHMLVTPTGVSWFATCVYCNSRQKYQPISNLAGEQCLMWIDDWSFKQYWYTDIRIPVYANAMERETDRICKSRLWRENCQQEVMTAEAILSLANISAIYSDFHPNPDTGFGFIYSVSNDRFRDKYLINQAVFCEVAKSSVAYLDFDFNPNGQRKLVYFNFSMWLLPLEFRLWGAIAVTLFTVVAIATLFEGCKRKSCCKNIQKVFYHLESGVNHLIGRREVRRRRGRHPRHRHVLLQLLSLSCIIVGPPYKKHVTTFLSAPEHTWPPYHSLDSLIWAGYNITDTRKYPTQNLVALLSDDKPALYSRTNRPPLTLLCQSVDFYLRMKNIPKKCYTIQERSESTHLYYFAQVRHFEWHLGLYKQLEGAGLIRYWSDNDVIQAERYADARYPNRDSSRRIRPGSLNRLVSLFWLLLFAQIATLGIFLIEGGIKLVGKSLRC